jgi:hypothetical protein
MFFEKVLTSYWASFVKDVLWQSIKRAVLYSIILAVLSLLLAVFVINSLTPPGEMSLGDYLVFAFLALAYLAGGFVCGFLAGITGIRVHKDRIADAVFRQTPRHEGCRARPTQANQSGRVPRIGSRNCGTGGADPRCEIEVTQECYSAC